MLDDGTRFQAIDEAALLTLLADTEVCRKKLLLYEQLAVNPTVKKFFGQKSTYMNKVQKKLRKALKLPEGTQWT